MNKAVFFDRDGVINKAVVKEGKPYPPATIDELEFIDGVQEGLKQLKGLGFIIIVCTNQPDVARGKTLQSAVDVIHKHLEKILPIDEVYCCFHDDVENCHCRKPKPGMLLDAAKKWNIDLQHSFMVGDRWRDIEAGKQAGVTTILIDYNYDEKKTEPDFTTTDFKKVINYIINKQ